MARPGVRGEAARYLAQQRELGEDELNLKLKPPRPAAKKLPGLDDYRRQISSCRKCPLWKTRTSFVFGDGAPDARLVFVGEAPGQDIEAIKLKRSEVFICNILKCRPPGNRNPLPEEIRQCEPHLRAQLEIIKPKVICALGTFAAQTLLQNNTPISKLRGRIHHYQNIKLVPTYHPAALLRNPGWKRPTWEDVQLVRKIYDGEA